MPVFLEHSENMEIVEAAGREGSFAQCSFEHESETARDGGAFRVGHGAMDFDTVQFKLVEQVRGERAAGVGHKALALEGFAQPVADLGFVEQLVNFRGADDAGELAAMPDPRRDRVAGGELLEARPDEGESVVGSEGGIDPGEPLAQVGAVLVDEREDGFGVALFKDSKLEVGPEDGAEHRSSVLHI